MLPTRALFERPRVVNSHGATSLKGGYYHRLALHDSAACVDQLDQAQVFASLFIVESGRHDDLQRGRARRRHWTTRYGVKANGFQRGVVGNLWEVQIAAEVEMGNDLTSNSASFHTAGITVVTV